MLEGVLNMLDRATKLDAVTAWLYANDPETQEEIIRLNTEDQLGNNGEGVDANGEDLGEYTPYTVNARRSKGLQTNHVSFEDTGGYLNSWRTRVTNDAVIITVDTERYNELVNELRFSEDHVGITPENRGFLVKDYYTPKYREYANGIIFQ